MALPMESREAGSDAEDTREQIEAGADAALLVCDHSALPVHASS